MESRLASINIGEVLRNNAGELEGWAKEKSSCSRASILRLEKELNLIRSHNSTAFNRAEEERIMKHITEMRREEEDYWAQRSRIEWLKSGDSNSKYFHAYASQRRKVNKIAGLFDARGTWREDMVGMETTINEYFVNLFKSNGRLSWISASMDDPMFC